MTEENVLKNKIEYWSKHQELDKFIYNADLVRYLSLITILSAIAIPLIIYFATGNFLFHLMIMFSIFFITYSYLISRIMVSSYRQNRAFRIREGMLRVFYNRLFAEERNKKNVTDELDRQFEEIRQGYRRNMSNKDIETLAKRIMEK